LDSLLILDGKSALRAFERDVRLAVPPSTASLHLVQSASQNERKLPWAEKAFWIKSIVVFLLAPKLIWLKKKMK